MSFLTRRRVKTGDSTTPRPNPLFARSRLSTIFTRAKHPSVGQIALPVVTDDIHCQHPLTRSASRESRSSQSSRCPSQEEIRRPSGLGQRAEVLDLVHPDKTVAVVGIHRDSRLKPVSESHSKSRSKASSRQWSVATVTTVSTIENGLYEIQDMMKTQVPWLPICRVKFPQELLSAVFAFLCIQDLLSVARVSTSFLVHARKLLYESMDLHAFPLERIDKCVEILASSRDLASIVRTFTSPKIPSLDNDPPLSFLTFTIALYNMSQLTSLSLPGFDANLLHHTNFRLQRVTFWSETMSDTEQQQFFAWLTIQTELRYIALPALITDIAIPSAVRRLTTENLEAINFGEQSFPLSPLVPIAPKIVCFEGPPSLAMRLVPGKPVSDVILHIQKTLYEGFKPSALMASLVKSTVPITRLSIIPNSSVDLDVRTLERVLMSAGADIGSSVQTLEMNWLFDEHVLYKSLLAILSRFTSLQTLHLRCKPVSCASSSPSTPIQMSFPSPISHTSMLTLPSPYQQVSGSSSSSLVVSDSGSVSSTHNSDTRESREHKYLKTWTRACPSLRTVVFLSGAEWCVVNRRKKTITRGKKNGATENSEENTVKVLSFVRWRLEE